MASSTKKALVAALSVATVAGTLAISVAPAEAGHRGYSHGGYRYYGHRHSGRGAAVAAGVVGGLALGALAAGAARPAYAAPVYGEDCYVVRRRFVDTWGRTFVRRETVCE
jgi:hypothetical protein